MIRGLSDTAFVLCVVGEDPSALVCLVLVRQYGEEKLGRLLICLY